MQGINCGACNYLLKPARLEELKNIWQHVIRKRIFSRGTKLQLHGNFNNQITITQTHHVEDSKEENVDDQDHKFNEASSFSSSKKKPRVVWTHRLHQKFVDAVNLLGIDSKSIRVKVTIRVQRCLYIYIVFKTDRSIVVKTQESCSIWLIYFFGLDRGGAEEDPESYSGRKSHQGKCRKPSSGKFNLFNFVAKT